MLSYTPTFLKSLRIIALDALFTRFANSVRNRYNRLAKKSQGIQYKHRAGWKVALRRCSIDKISIPAIISSNVRSLMGKIDDVNNLVHMNECRSLGVILLQESWLHADIDSDVVQLDGFSIFRSDRAVNFRNRGGGVITFINRNWCNSSHILFQFSSSKINCIIVRCKPRFLIKFRYILIANIYISPDTPTSEVRLFTDSLSNELVTSLDQALCIVAGDFNRFDMTFLTTLGLVNVVSFPTRLDSQLDHVYVNNPGIFSIKKRAPISNSDHCIIFMQPKIYSKSNHKLQARCNFRTLQRRNCSPENLEKLRDMIYFTDFSIFNNPDHSSHCEHLTDYLNFCFNTCCPVETIYIRTDRFSSPLLKRLRRDKERAYMTGRRSYVKHLTALIKEEIKRLNRMYTETILGNKNCREMWSALKRLCGASESSCPDVEELNQQFAAASVNNPLPFSFHTSEAANPVSSAEVIKILRELKTNKANGPDFISPILLKACAEQLATPIADLFTFCLSSGKIPDCWRSARIRPIPKKGTTKYRPIACTSVLLKVFEKVLLNRVTPMFDSHDPLQFAYKPSLSTLDATAHVVNSVASALDKGLGTVRLSFLDYSNAFGSLDRGILIQLLHDYGVMPNYLNVLIDYFSQRTQFTSCSGKNSSSLPIDSGVFQGAILSPFFFSLYINALPIPPNFIACKYADDVVIGCHCTDTDSFQELQDSLTSLFNWSSPRSLSLNVLKCVDIPFSLKTGSRYESVFSNLTPLVVNGQNIPIVESVKYLGITLSHNLSWSPHVQTVFTKVRRLSFYALRLRKLAVPHNLILKFVIACVLPHWLYCSPIFFPGLKEQDYVVIIRSLNLLSRCSGVTRATLVDFIVEKHFDACHGFSSRLLSDTGHCLHFELSKAVSNPRTRSNFRLLHARTSMYRNSIIPYLARFLVDRTSIVNSLKERLLR